jgi:hypothetical protein
MAIDAEPNGSLKNGLSPHRSQDLSPNGPTKRTRPRRQATLSPVRFLASGDDGAPAHFGRVESKDREESRIARLGVGRKNPVL